VPVIILTDETVGHMHEKVVIPPADQIEIVPRNNYKRPQGRLPPLQVRLSGGHPMTRAGDGYNSILPAWFTTSAAIRS